MAKVRQFVGEDTSRIWELLNEIGAAVNPVVQDTGTRDILTALVNGGGIALLGGVALRRVGDRVTVAISVKVAAGSGLVGATRNGAWLVAMPPGFQPYHNAPTIFAHASTTAGVGYMQWNTSTARLTIGGLTGTWAANDTIYAEVSYLTRDPWPSTLPGSAA